MHGLRTRSHVLQVKDVEIAYKEEIKDLDFDIEHMYKEIKIDGG